MNDLELHQRFKDYSANAREWMRKCVLLLPEIARRQIWKRRGFGSLHEYAAKLAGMSRGTVDEALRVLKKIEDKPALQAVVASRGLQRVRPIVSIATVETQEFWAKKARQMGKHTLETYVKNFSLESLPGEETQSVKLTMDLDPKTAARLEKMKGEGTWDALFQKLLRQEAAPEPVRTDSRHIPMRIQRFVRERSAGLCAYPSCTRPATSLHHTQRWGLERVHDPHRLHALCTPHERLAHLGLVEEDGPSETWRVRAHADPLSSKRFIDTMVALYRPT